MAKGRNPEFIKVEKFINSGKGTIADYRKLNPGSPEFKVKIGSIANKNAIVSYKKAGTKDAVTRRAAQIKKNRPTDEVFDEAGKLWDELVGDKGSFTMGGKTFTSKEQYQKFESKRHNQLTSDYTYNPKDS